MNLSERCERLKQELNSWRSRIQGGYPVSGSMNEILENFAREIRAETLEEAAKVADLWEPDDTDGVLGKYIRALKDIVGHSASSEKKL